MYRQGAQQYLMKNRKDRGVGANAQCKRGDCDGRDERSFEEGTQSQSCVDHIDLVGCTENGEASCF
jgi:hypothetical protein